MIRPITFATAVTAAFLLNGCSMFHSERTVPTTNDIRLTAETVENDEDGTVIIILFPRGTEEPRVFLNEETGQWAAGAAIQRN